jgi:hypothetical protein
MAAEIGGGSGRGNGKLPREESAQSGTPNIEH